MARCHACGHGFTYRDGIRYCAACAAPVASDCTACGRLWQPGDRYCPFCAAPTGASEATKAPLAGPGAPDDAEELRQLALDTLARAALTMKRQAFPAAKANLDQDDVDSLFSGQASRT